MVFGVARGPPVDETDLTTFIETLSGLPAEEWQKRIAALKNLVDSIPDYSTTPLDENGEIIAPTTPSSQQQAGGENNVNGSRSQKSMIPWYRSSKSVRRLYTPLKMLLLDARSAVVKEATELIGTLFMVKLQPHPSLTMDTKSKKDGQEKVDDIDEAISNNGGLETINGALDAHQKKVQQPPPPAFVGRLLIKDLLPAILDMSKQTVKVIRTYGVNMMIDILPHCRVKSCTVILLERMKTHQNRTVREDCARYIRCVLETWPWDSTGSCDTISNENISIVNSRKEERLSLDSTRQIGLGLGRTLSDSAKPVREEAKRGFQVLFRRFRPIWDEVMSSGVVRDVRLRKKLLETASRSDSGNNNLFDDMASLGEMSLNSAVSGMSYRSTMSNRSYASRGMVTSNTGVPSMIGTPKVSPGRVRSRGRYSPSSPSYMRGTGSSTARVSEQAKIQAKEGPSSYRSNEYVTSSGHVVSTPSPRKGKYSKPTSLYGGDDVGITTQQPFASLLSTPNHSLVHLSPESKPKSSKLLRKRLSRRISGIKEEPPQGIQSPSNLTSISEADDDGHDDVCNDANPAEITNVALEVIAAHLSHLEQVEALISKEKEILSDLNKQLGISITDGTKTAELADRLGTLSEEQVCDYFESVHVCVDKQRDAGEILLREMERISEGDVSTVSGIASPEMIMRGDLAQAPTPNDLDSMQRDLKDEF